MTEPAGTSPSSAAAPNYDYSSGAAELRGEVYHPPEYLVYLERAAAAMKTIRLIVYAGLASFVILAVYGFVLIYKLTGDVHVMVGEARAMTGQMGLMTQQMQAMTRSMANLNQSTAGMAGDLGAVKGTMAEMEGAMARMAEAVTLMQHSARNVDQSLGPVMGSINRFFPMGFSGYPGAPPYAR